MKRCIDCRWYHLPVMSDRCSNCKQVNPNKTTDHWEEPASYRGVAGLPPPKTKPSQTIKDIEDYMSQVMGMPDRIAKHLKLQEEKEESSINPMIVIEAKLK